MDKKQIGEFLHKLSRKVKKEGCQGDYRHAKEVLRKMGVSQGEMNKVVAMCQGFGGFCDCEILLNSWDQLMA